MLLITRNVGQSVMIGEIECYVSEIDKDTVRLSFNDPTDSAIDRAEVRESKQADGIKRPKRHGRSLRLRRWPKP